MAGEIIAAIQSLKVASDLAAGINNLQKKTDINLAVSSVLAKLVDALYHVQKLQAWVNETQEELARLKRVDESKFEYAVVEHKDHTYSGLTAPRSKETGLFFCPVCFADRKLVPLQFDKSGMHAKRCGSCKTPFGSSDAYQPPSGPFPI